jgi:outer membrane protein OmpA-like peptidoglycan-associated protein
MAAAPSAPTVAAAVPAVTAPAIRPAADTAAAATAAPASAAASAPAPVAVAAPPAPKPAEPAAASSPQAVAAGAEIDELLKGKVIEFSSGSAILTARGRDTVRQLLPLLKRNPGLRFEVQGHTDNLGTEAINLALSQARADAVKAELGRQGMDASRLQAKGYGAAQPVADNTTGEGRARNRRIAVRVEENK